MTALTPIPGDARVEGVVTYEMQHDQLRDLGSFALGAMEIVAVSHQSPDVREFAQQQLDNWARHGFIKEVRS